MREFTFSQTADVDEFEAGYQAFCDGRMAEERFTPFRLQMGVYGQRQEGVQMLRVKLPGGLLTPDQLDVIGDCVEAYAGQMPTDGTLTTPPHKFAHVTTRQDIQANFVALNDVVPFLRRLDAVGLTTREACGNTVRNVTSCFLSGRCPSELVDVNQHAQRFTEFFLRHPLAQQFPRKFKVTFSACATDCGMSGMHDIGFIAKTENGAVGFEVWAAGGLSSQPIPAILLESFVPEADILLVGEALMRIHFKFSDRKRRARARMKYVMQTLGAEGFIEEYRKQRAVIDGTHQPEALGAKWRAPTTTGAPYDDSGVVVQHDGQRAILINLFRGDLTPLQCRAVAQAARLGGSKDLRVTTEQGMVIAGVDEDKVEVVLEMLAHADLQTSYARGISDIVACPGTETCRLGITSSRGLAAAMQPLMIDLKADPTLAGLTVKASGCQHSCGRHHIADLGFHGMAKKVAGQAVPHYQLHLGGSGVAGQAFAYATDPVPAKSAPEAGIAVLQAYKSQRFSDAETMHAWVTRVGKDEISTILAPFKADEGEVEGLIYDWSENEAFNTKGNKKGECAGAVLSMSDALISEAEYELLIARAHIDAMFWSEALTALRRSMTSTARAFLVGYGEAPDNDAEVLGMLMGHAMGDALVIQGFQAVQSAMMGIDLAEPAAGVLKFKEAQSTWLALAEKRFAAVPEYVAATVEVEQAPASIAMTTPEVETAVVLDLSGVACPMNFVKTKIKLSTMSVGSQLQVILDDGAPIKNVPLSLEEQGQKVLAQEKISENQWKILVEKCA
ncbi:MAG: sulfurtransferase TusA family protein [Zetaproteobacteria bacterium]|nr:sulfurtransferase TusA family protein [Zetaproteobacteria bacterium]